MNVFQRIPRKLIRTFQQRKKNYMIKKRIGRKIKISISDLLYCNSRNGQLLRLDIVVRYMAIKSYIKGEDHGWDLYRRMQDSRKGNGYSLEAEKRFRELIDSYIENGYDDNSCIMLDKNFGLIDGSHRIALALYHGYSTISALVMDFEHPVDYSFDWFMGNGFSSDEVQQIVKTGQELFESVQKPFSCIIWSPAVPFTDEIIKDLGMFGEIVGYQKYSYKEEEYKNVVKAIYAIDDIESWKIEKKLEHMADSLPELCAIDLKVTDPIFRQKGKTGNPLSTVGEHIKKAIRSKYQNRIDNYFFDIILHIGDNIYQSNYMRNVLTPPPKFHKLIEILDNYAYAFTKVDVPYMPADFPKNIPVGKDADILCDKHDALKMNRHLVEWCQNFKGFQVIHLDEKSGYRIRIQMDGVLFYQIDVSWGVDGLREGFVEEALKLRKKKETYYILDERYEYLIRANAYQKKPSKVYHREWMMAHHAQYDKKLSERYALFPMDVI